MKTTTWDVPGCCTIELDRATCPLPAITAMLVGDYAELVIQFRAKGWSTPASMYGGPDRLGWPAEGDEERTLTDVLLCQDGSADLRLEPALAEQVFERWNDVVLKADVTYRMED